jgi:MFS family permease
VGITRPRPGARLPLFYGWLIVAVAFVTMAIAVSARTAFSLLLPPLISEFGWDRGLVAGAFSFGFMVSAVLSPIAGRMIDRRGPRLVIECGVGLMGAGLLAAPLIAQPWQLYATLGGLVGAGANLMGFTVQSLYLPNWFVRRRALAISMAFSGVGFGAVLLLPWLQTMIAEDGWRSACRVMGLLVLLVLGPLNLLVRRRPQDMGMLPDGMRPASADGTPGAISGTLAGTEKPPSVMTDRTVVDQAWVATEWTLPRAIRTARFWWIALGYFFALFSWYAVQVHQTAYLIEIGFSRLTAAWALGIVSVIAIPGQIGFGALSDRIGREWIWAIGCAGFAICYAALIGLEQAPSTWLLYVMIVAQGFLGYAITSVMGPIVVEIFEGPHYGAIFGTLTVGMIAGGAAGPLVAGVVHDLTGSYRLAFLLAMAGSVVSAAAVWMASPRKVRLVPGRLARA